MVHSWCYRYRGFGSFRVSAFSDNNLPQYQHISQRKNIVSNNEKKNLRKRWFFLLNLKDSAAESLRAMNNACVTRSIAPITTMQLKRNININSKDQHFQRSILNVNGIKLKFAIDPAVISTHYSFWTIFGLYVSILMTIGRKWIFYARP